MIRGRKNSVRPTGHANAKRRGGTLIEVSVAALLTGTVMVAALNTAGGVIKTRRHAAEYADGAQLAHQLMGEIIALPYEDPEEPGGAIGRESGESGDSRVDFDDVDDYDDWDQEPPEYKDETEMPGWTGWRRQVFVNFAMLEDPLTNSPTDTGLKRIHVQVVAPDDTTTDLIALRCRSGAIEQPLGADTTVVSSVSGSLQIGNQPVAVISGGNLQNHAEDQ